MFFARHDVSFTSLLTSYKQNRSQPSTIGISYFRARAYSVAMSVSYTHYSVTPSCLPFGQAKSFEVVIFTYHQNIITHLCHERKSHPQFLL
jgi:hypothetical protein